MSTAMETSLADMKAGFPFAPEPIQGIPTLESLIELLFHMCRCAQTHRSPASDTTNLLFRACPCPIYGFFTADAYPDAFAPIPPPVDKVPDDLSQSVGWLRGDILLGFLMRENSKWGDSNQ